MRRAANNLVAHGAPSQGAHDGAGLETLWAFRDLTVPWHGGIAFAFMLTSHKLCRWLVYLALPLALAGLVLLCVADRRDSRACRRSDLRARRGLRCHSLARWQARAAPGCIVRLRRRVEPGWRARLAQKKFLLRQRMAQLPERGTHAQTRPRRRGGEVAR